MSECPFSQVMPCLTVLCGPYPPHPTGVLEFSQSCLCGVRASPLGPVGFRPSHTACLTFPSHNCSGQPSSFHQSPGEGPSRAPTSGAHEGLLGGVFLLHFRVSWSCVELGVLLAQGPSAPGLWENI